jgi:hypothetical protein
LFFLQITGALTKRTAISATQRSPGFWKRATSSSFYIKLTNWEYWPLPVANLPVVAIWLWYALRARQLFFFTAVNPVIETGGAWGESKIGILQRIPETYLPTTLFFEKDVDFQQVIQQIEAKGLVFPIIAKPDIGERGLLVSKIKSAQDLANYMAKNRMNFLIQAFLDLPLELAVLHHRMPGESKGCITSVCVKETLKVTGDGHSSIHQLMEAYPRAKLQIPRFEAAYPELLKMVLPPGEVKELEPIGNHCRGTMFLNGNHHIDEAFTAAFDEVVRQMDGIHYGRFDMKCTSVEDIRQGKGFMVMEYNGIGAEPAHIYDPTYPVLKKYRDIFRHWKIIYRIYRRQADRGVGCMTLSEGIRSLKAYSDYKKSLRTTPV